MYEEIRQEHKSRENNAGNSAGSPFGDGGSERQQESSKQDWVQERANRIWIVSVVPPNTKHKQLIGQLGPDDIQKLGQ
ncbi:MAG: hypothetical protein ACK2U2_05405 [Anaerolineae bacterium]